MDTKQTIKKEQTNNKKVKRDYIYAVGRQKEAVARVRLYSQVKEDAKWGEHAIKKEQILVNALPVESYFPGPIAKSQYMQPLKLTETIRKFAVTVKVAGGGRNGQLHAMIKGIARALSQIDPQTFRPKLKAAGFLTRDARIRERRKVGTGGKARRKKQSPKR